METFLKNVHLPSMKKETKDSMEESVQLCEIKAAIKSLSNGKTPGNDGFTVEFFKCFQDVLMPFLTTLFNDIISKQSMPPTMRQASLSLIPKPGKDHQKMGNYRPLSILNNDYKLFAKILAKRIEKVIPTLIHIDQVGFMKGRLASNNIRRLLHVMKRAEEFQHPAIAISLDAEKAFDRIEWEYLFFILSRYGFGPNFIKWARSLYHQPVTRIKSNGLLSEPIHLYRSTR